MNCSRRKNNMSVFIRADTSFKKHFSEVYEEVNPVWHDAILEFSILKNIIAHKTKALEFFFLVLLAILVSSLIFSLLPFLCFRCAFPAAIYSIKKDPLKQNHSDVTGAASSPLQDCDPIWNHVPRRRQWFILLYSELLPLSMPVLLPDMPHVIGQALQCSSCFVIVDVLPILKIQN